MTLRCQNDDRTRLATTVRVFTRSTLWASIFMTTFLALNGVEIVAINASRNECKLSGSESRLLTVWCDEGLGPVVGIASHFHREIEVRC